MDSDSERLHFFGEDLREACQGMLGGGIGTLVGVALEAHDRGYVDHHRLRGFLKIRQGSLAEEERGAGIDCEYAVPLLRGHLGETPGLCDSGAIDKQIHTAEPPHGLADYLFWSILIGKIRRNAHHTDVGVPRCRLRFFSHGVKSRCVPAYQGKVKTKGGQFESDCLSDSSRRSCYDRFTFHLYSRILCFQD